MAARSAPDDGKSSWRWAKKGSAESAARAFAKFPSGGARRSVRALPTYRPGGPGCGWNSGEPAVAVLVLTARAARAGYVAGHLAPGGGVHRVDKSGRGEPAKAMLLRGRHRPGRWSALCIQAYSHEISGKPERFIWTALYELSYARFIGPQTSETKSPRLRLTVTIASGPMLAWAANRPSPDLPGTAY